MGIRTGMQWQQNRRSRQQIIFWVGILLLLLLSLPRLLRDPMQFDDRFESGVIITEFVARNQSGLVDDEGAHVDWIELYNRAGHAVQLDGWSLTDDPNRPAKWRFPAITLPANGYLVVYASGKDGITWPAAESGGQDLPVLHTNFRLNGDAGFLALYPPTTRRFLDSFVIRYGPQPVDTAYGRVAGAERFDSSTEAYALLTNPTPGMANDVSSALPPETAPVQPSVGGGLYEQPLSVTLQSSTPNSQIWYTTDGSVPVAEQATRYREPLWITTTTVLRAVAIADGAGASVPGTHSYLFPRAVLTQAADPPGWPAAWGTHRLTFAGANAGEPVQADYGMDPRIAAAPARQEQLLAGLRDLPTLALTLPPADFAALYSDPQRRGVEAEYATAVEFFPTDAQASPFRLDAGLRIQGGAGRWEYMPKHSFRLFFKGAYGATKLAYPMFPDSPVTAFDTLVLRAGVDRSFAGHPDTADLHQTTYARDEWARATQRAMSGVGAHGRFVHLYINGLYWGLYNVVERPDASFAAAYYGGNKDEWATVNHGGAVSGQFDRFGTLVRLAEEGGLADPAAYATMLEFIDPVQFSDYLILNWYMGNTDWPENNWYVNVHYPAGRNRFFVWDAESTWDAGALLTLGGDRVEGAPFPNVIKLIWQALRENSDFQQLFADRLYHHLSAGGALHPEQAQQRWQQITAPLANAIAAESARWGDVRSAMPITVADWQRAVEQVAAQMADNDQRMVRLMREAGYYPAIDPPVLTSVAERNANTLTFQDRLTLTLQSAVGEIYYTLDGTDPRQAGGDVAPAALRYSAPPTVATATTVKARVRLHTATGPIWSALADWQLIRAGQAADLRIVEIMYHADGGAEYEYLELVNSGDLSRDLSRAYFTGIDYHFPEGTALAPGQRFALIRDFRKFRERYPTAEFNGLYAGELSNYGETIALHASDGEIITAVSYQPANGWPVSAAGMGDSLVLHDPAADPSLGSSWRASANLYGSPGEDEP